MKKLFSDHFYPVFLGLAEKIETLVTLDTMFKRVFKTKNEL
jgi:hypothetical protein